MMHRINAERIYERQEARWIQYFLNFSWVRWADSLPREILQAVACHFVNLKNEENVAHIGLFLQREKLIKRPKVVSLGNYN